MTQPVLGRDTALALHGARWDADGRRCELGPVALKIPLDLDPHLVLEASLRYFAYSAEGRSVEVPSVTVQEIDWERSEDDVRRIVQSETRTVVTDAEAVARLRQATGGERVAVVESWRTPGGRSLAVGGEVWRLVAPSAQRLPVAADDAGFAPLRRSAEGALCRRIPLGWATQPGFSNDMFEHGRHCYAITRGNPAPDTPAAAATAREQVLVAVYEEPDGDALAHLTDNPPAPVASLTQFARVAPGSADWRVGTTGAFDGWLALRAADARGQPRLIGVPWSTCALWRLGRELLQHDPAAVAAADPFEARVCGGHAEQAAAAAKVRP